jgi:WD40 repeat protein
MQVLTSADGNVAELAFAPDGRALVAAVAHQVPFLWDIPATTAPKALAEYRVANGPDPYNVTFSPDSKIVGWLRDLSRWEYDRDTGDERQVQLTDPVRAVISQTLTGPDSWLVVSTTTPSGGNMYRCLTPDGAGNWEERWVKQHEELLSGSLTGTKVDRVFAWQFHRAGKPSLVMLSALSGRILAQAPLPFQSASGLTARVDGSEVVAFRTISLVAWRPGVKPQKVRTDTRTRFHAVRYHPSGKYLFVACEDTLIRVFDTSSWRVVKEYAWNIGKLSAVAVSSDGTLAAAGGEHGQVVVWDLDL